jgi:hypothetical protein
MSKLERRINSPRASLTRELWTTKRRRPLKTRQAKARAGRNKPTAGRAATGSVVALAGSAARRWQATAHCGPSCRRASERRAALKERTKNRFTNRSSGPGETLRASLAHTGRRCHGTPPLSETRLWICRRRRRIRRECTGSTACASSARRGRAAAAIERGCPSRCHHRQ